MVTATSESYVLDRFDVTKRWFNIDVEAIRQSINGGLEWRVVEYDFANHHRKNH